MDRKKLFFLLIIVISFVQTYAQKPQFEIKLAENKLSLEKFSRYYYSSFDLEKPSTVYINSNLTISDIEISPKIFAIPFNLIDNNRISINLSEPGHYLVRINDSIKIFLFANKPVETVNDQIVNLVTKYNIDNTGKTNETARIQQALDEISGSGKILYFPPGIYKSGQLNLKSNSKVQFARGAVLTADTGSVKFFSPTDYVENRRFIYLNGVENVEITGQGVIDGNGKYLRNKYGDDARIRLILAVKSKNILIEGLILKDPGSWNTQLINCNGVILRNLKLLNDIDISNTDGFDPDASSNILIEDCFAYCGDDNVAVKVTGRKNLVADVDNVTVRGCVFLTKKSALKIGTETRSNYIKNITFENNDVIECDRGMAIYVYDGATLDNIFYINNRFERNYPDAQRKAIHFEVDKRNPESKLGFIKNVLIRDCNFINQFPNKSVIEYNGDTIGINVTIQNLNIAGIKVESLESARINAIKSSVTFK
ncbi:MAG: glycosyl hydrolase family 28 protein [Bacteroidales bacterium]